MEYYFGSIQDNFAEQDNFVEIEKINLNEIY
jgi:hypothetical protein